MTVANAARAATGRTFTRPERTDIIESYLVDHDSVETISARYDAEPVEITMVLNSSRAVRKAREAEVSARDQAHFSLMEARFVDSLRNGISQDIAARLAGLAPSAAPAVIARARLFRELA